MMVNTLSANSTYGFTYMPCRLWLQNLETSISYSVLLVLMERNIL